MQFFCFGAIVFLHMEDQYLDSYWEDRNELAAPDADYDSNVGNDTSEYDGEPQGAPEPPEDNFRDAVDADANALAGIGWGEDEQYGHYEESGETY